MGPEGRDTAEIKDFLHEKNMEWKFVTTVAAHHNGCAESLIRLTNAALNHDNTMIGNYKEYCRWKFRVQFYTFIKPNQEELRKMQLFTPSGRNFRLRNCSTISSIE